MIKAIVFDFFGVIGQGAFQLVHQRFDTTDEQDSQFRDLHKALDNKFIGQEEFIKQYAEILRISTEQMKKYYYDIGERLQSSPKMLEYIDGLRSNFKVGLLSNVSFISYLRFIKPLKNHFDAVVTSYKYNLAKPDEAIYKLTAAKLKADVSECVMVDDLEINCEGARVAGMQAIQFESFKQLKRELEKLLSDN